MSRYCFPKFYEILVSSIINIYICSVFPCFKTLESDSQDQKYNLVLINCFQIMYTCEESWLLIIKSLINQANREEDLSTVLLTKVQCYERESSHRSCSTRHTRGSITHTTPMLLLTWTGHMLLTLF